MALLRPSWKTSYVATIAVCGVAAVIVPPLLSWLWPALIEPLELRTVDLRFRHRPDIAVAADRSLPKSDALVEIDYDDRAAHEYGLGRWPWDRRTHARVFDLLKSAEARLVMVDLLFDFNTQDPTEDQAMAQATRRAGMVIFPVVFTSVSEHESTDAFRFSAPQHLLPAAVDGLGTLPGVGELALPLPKLTESAAGLGHILRTTDRDGVLRRIPLVYATKGGFVPALSLAAALRLLNVDRASVRIERGAAIRFKLPQGEEVAIPIDAHGRTWINYAGPWGKRFHHYPYSWILDQMKTESGKAQLQAGLEGKTVVLSNLTTGFGDRVATPLDPDFPTSESHLHILNMILHQQFVRDAGAVLTLFGYALPVLFLTVAALYGGPLVVIPTFAAVLAVYLMLLQLSFNWGGVVLPAAGPIMAMSLGAMALLTARLLLVDRERKRFQSALGACLPPQTIQLIKESPERIPSLLAGRSRELTILFADIRGFSAFCKRADPLLIQRVLRDYLTAMTVILRANGGTLNKYMGDGIMAFFGDADAEQGGEAEREEQVGHHAANAVRTGLAMQKRMGELNAEWVSQGQEMHLVRIGINTGVVTVGNLGTEYLWDYTVIGPEVNKAQRLESAAQPGGLLLSRRTYALAKKRSVLPDGLACKNVHLKGIGEEMDLYEIQPELIDQLTAS